MRKTFLTSVVILAICFISCQIVLSQDVGSATRSMVEMDESQIIVAEYSWGNEQYLVSLADLSTAMEELSNYRRRKLQSRESKTEYLTELIVDNLKILVAEEKGFDEEPEYLKQAEDYKHQLMVEKISKVEVDEKVSYTEEELKQHYEQHKSEPSYVVKAQSRATAISLTDKELAQETLDQIKAGKDIIQAAEELSEAKKLTGPGSGTETPGDTGFFAQDISPNWKPFLDEVFAQEIGELTDTVFEIEVQDNTYYLIFRKEDYKPERRKEFDEVQARIKRKIEREKKKQRINSWIEEIAMKGKLQTYPGLIPEPPPDEEDNDEHDESSESAESHQH